MLLLLLLKLELVVNVTEVALGEGCLLYLRAIEVHVADPIEERCSHVHDIVQIQRIKEF